MIQLSVLYPAGDDATFDHDYYRDHHVPLAAKLWNPASYQVERGVDGPYAAALHLRFDSNEAMGDAMGGPGTAELQADVPNYTNITPVLQISEIVEA
ncbi:MAG TPA: EthD family reductase [Mycobacteriales bacterium]|nr:EthD family reductase [Mycobacteriales bacterium]